MDINKVSEVSAKVIKYLDESALKPDEKIAILKTAASTIENVLQAEAFSLIVANMLGGQRK